MIRRIFLLCFAIMVVGFGPAVAQSYFIKQNKSPAEAGEKPSIFNKPKKSAATKKQSVIKYADKLKVKQLKLKSSAKADALDYWQESGAKPTNAQEIMMYADAHRAKAQEAMYQRREALIAHIQKQELTSQKGEVSNKTAGAIDLGVGGAGEVAENSPVQKTKTKKSKMFVKKPKENKAKPTKVFTGYR